MENLSLNDFRLGTGDLVQQIAMIGWLHKEEDGGKIYKAVTGGRVLYELWNRITGEDKLEVYRTAAISAIVDYIKKNPKASKEEITKVVEQQIIIFAARVESE